MAKIQTIEILDIENVKLEKLRYQKNSSAYILGFCAIIFSVFAAFIALNSLYPNYFTIIKILMNIGILLFGFLSCEKVKNYSKPYSYVMFGFAAICILRILWAPRLLINGWSKLVEGREIGGDQGDKLVSEAGKIIGESLTAQSSQQKGFLPQSGNLRATLCIVFLVTAAVLFALSGYIAYAKTKKLNNYLNSIETDESKGH